MRQPEFKGKGVALFTILIFGAIVITGISTWSAESLISQPDTYNSTLAEDENVIVISVDLLRADHVSCYGYHRNTTPNICDLASDGYRFENTYSEGTWTLPAQSSFMTSYYPEVNDVYEPGSKGLTSGRLNETYLTLPEIMKRNGYETAAFVGSKGNDTEIKFHLNSKYNLDQGFSVYSEEGRYFDSILPSAKNWIRENKEEKFFTLIHSYNLHPPFKQPIHDDRFDQDYQGKVNDREFPELGYIETDSNSTNYLLKGERENSIELENEDQRHLVAEYDGAIRHTDKRIGEFLEYLKQEEVYNDSVIILYSSHGVALGDRYRGKDRWGLFTTDNSVNHVPLVIKGPRDRSRDISGLAQLVDIGPTITDIVGINSGLSERQGMSLSNSLGDTTTERSYAFVSGAPNTKDAIYTDEWKYVPHSYLYRNDGSSEREYGDERPELVEKLSAVLDNQQTENLKLKSDLKTG